MKTILEDVLFKFISILNTLGIDYTMIGGIASGIYGLPRTTYDIDMLLTVEKIKIPIFIEMLKNNGFSFDEKQTMEELKEGYLSEIYYQNIRIDILLPILPFFKKIIEQSKIFNLSNNEVRFATAEDLVILKLLSHREHDKEDITIIKALQKLDIGYIKDSLRSLVGEEHASFIVFKQIFKKGK